MTRDGLLFIEEWVGPSRTEWNDARMARMRALYDPLPAAWKAFPTLQPPIAADDPSEAVRSSAILPSVRRLFHVLVERPYGGHLVAVILSQLARDKVSEFDREALIERLLALEDRDLAEDPSCTFHTALVAQKRRGARRIAARVENLAARFALLWRYWTPVAMAESRRQLRRVLGRIWRRRRAT